MFVPIAHSPGHAQADFRKTTVAIGGVERKAHFFAIDLAHSGARHVRACQAATAAAWVDGHVHAFGLFECVPTPILYDPEFRLGQMPCRAHLGRRGPCEAVQRLPVI